MRVSRVLAICLALAACSNGTIEGDPRDSDGGGLGPSGDGAIARNDGGGAGDEDASTGPSPVPVGTIAELLVPFDANREDLVGPDDHAAMYGKSPEIVPVPDGTSVDLLVQDHASDATPRAMIVRLAPDGDDLVITRAIEAPILDRVMGLARDESGAYFVASGADEAERITQEYPAPGTYREGVVRVVELDAAGAIGFDVDLDTARAAVRADAEPLINPMVAASARLAYGDGLLALVHGNNTVPDGGGVRHQKAVTTVLRADTGAVTRTSTIWCSHSFDQRLTHDGTGFVEMHLGDAYPRFIALSRTTAERVSDTYPLFHVKGSLGDNNTHTRLGAFAAIEGAGEMGWLALFASEHTTGTSAIEGASRVAGARDLAIVRVRRDFDARGADENAFLDPALPDRLDVTSSGDARENRLQWLTDYQSSDAGAVHAERPKLVALGGNRFVVLWERWARADRGFAFTGTWGTVIDASGATIVEARELTEDHLPRGDDAFRLGDDAAFVIGDREARTLRVHRVSASLEDRVVVVE
ncbi:hypothetical protein [Sandaracinus amylolyticus]|uniref:hypothetical protein n=1 Tax=Sandaracinus amylolyticus TaxID=927083 RepID=UPI001F266B8D|nr:hypothetical protein [Sandaracinus amylolyticus]UJR85150.1 Hypothetical protein I5071_72300 [Sandaracinus amylolyticus]